MTGRRIIDAFVARILRFARGTRIFRLLIAGLLLVPLVAEAQTSWKGTTSTDWNNAVNWTAGVPTSSSDAIIGDANFTGANQPSLTASSSCRSLTIGAGTTVSTLSVAK